MNAAEFYLEDLRSKFAKINPDEYYLAYSGGRDSHFLLWFIREYLHEKRIMAVFENTAMELPEIRNRALANADVVLKPAMKHAEIKEKYGIPLNSKASDEWVWKCQQKRDQGVADEDMPNTIKHMVFRDVNATPRGRERGELSQFAVNKKTSDAVINRTLHKVSPLCCKYLKKIPGSRYKEETGRKPILGIMGTESLARRSVYTSCFTKDRRFVPLWDLTEELRDEIEKYCDIPVPYVYKYIEQTGCAGCPYGQHGKDPFKKTDIELTLCGEGQRKFILDYFGESYKFKGYYYQPMMFLEEQ